MKTTLTLAIAFLCTASVHAQKLHLVVRGSKPGQGLGMTLAPAGDVDRDGKADFLVSAPATFGAGAGVPSVRVISGRNGKAIHVLTGYDLGGGASIDGGYDADKDGYPDFLVGDPSANANGNQSGRVVVYSGKTGKPIVTSKGSGANRFFGRRARWVGDIDRDGAADFIAGQTGGSASPWYQVVVCSGADGRILWTIGGIGSKFAVGAVGDLDKDGYPEVMVRVTQGGTLEYFEIYSGKNGKPGWRSTPGHLGVDACWPGDMSGDGVGDLIVLFLQELVAFSGRDGSLLFRLRDRFGNTVAATGDVDGDGASDFAVTGSDHVRVYSGRLRQEIYRIPTVGVFPPVVGNVGDLDGDGALEFVVGRPTESSTPFQDGGAAYVFSSKRVDLSWRTFGRGCSGGALSPRLVIPPVPLRIGKTFDFDIDRLPGPTVGGLWISASNTSWSGGTLPFDLSVIGMGGCHLLVAPHIHLPFASTGTSVRLRVAVPFGYTYIGEPVFLQGYSADKKANSLGVATTGGLRGVLGS